MKYFNFIFLVCATLSSIRGNIVEKNRINPLIMEIFDTFPSLYTQEEYVSLQSINPYDLKHAVPILNALGQKYFLRPAHLSRLQPAELTEYYKKTIFNGLSDKEIDAVREKIYSLLQEAGYIGEILPQAKTFDYVLLLGSTVLNVWNRISFFNQLVQTGKVILSPDTKIILCVGERILEEYEKKDIETLFLQFNYTEVIPQDERELGKILLSFFPFCNEITKESLHIVNSSKQPGTPRATTVDNINDFLTHYYSNNKKTLVISSNPYVEYQLLTAQLCFLKNPISCSDYMSIEGAGFGSHLTLETFTLKDCGVYLDNIARTFYSLTKIYDIVPPSNNWIIKFLYDITNFFHTVIHNTRKLCQL